MKESLKRGLFSFAISAFFGLIINLLIDIIANMCGAEGFVSMSPNFIALFPTSVMATYVNIILYGLIGFVFAITTFIYEVPRLGFVIQSLFVFAITTFIYEVPRLGFVIQSLIYFVITGGFCVGVTIFLWQLHHYPSALIGTLSGYAVCHVIIVTAAYRDLKKDIKEINEMYTEDNELT